MSSSNVRLAFLFHYIFTCILLSSVPFIVIMATIFKIFFQAFSTRNSIELGPAIFIAMIEIKMSDPSIIYVLQEMACKILLENHTILGYHFKQVLVTIIMC